MKILFVHGGDNNVDYAAIDFENELQGDVNKFAQLCAENDGYYYNEQFDIAFQLLEFTDIDPKFISWLYNSDIIDYDTAKARNFYAVY